MRWMLIALLLVFFVGCEPAYADAPEPDNRQIMAAGNMIQRMNAAHPGRTYRIIWNDPEQRFELKGRHRSRTETSRVIDHTRLTSKTFRDALVNTITRDDR
jgi:hypothetical protein